MFPFFQRLHEVSELLNKKQNFLEKKVEDELDIIRKNGTKNKRVSMAALKRKKRYEEQLAKIDGKEFLELSPPDAYFLH